MGIVEVIRLDCKNDSAHWVRFIHDSLIFFVSIIVECHSRGISSAILSSWKRHHIKYEAATTLTTLTQNVVAVKGASPFYNVIFPRLMMLSCRVVFHHPYHQEIMSS